MNVVMVTTMLVTIVVLTTIIGVPWVVVCGVELLLLVVDGFVFELVVDVSVVVIVGDDIVTNNN